jgi:hypothetical protein
VGSAAVGQESAPAGERRLTSSPEPLGRWSSTFGSNRTFPLLGMRYRVIREFKDDDTHVHPVGEEWTFLGSSYVPYHSGAGFAVSFDDMREWLITFLDMPEGQGEVLANLEQYLAPVEDADRRHLHPQLPLSVATPAPAARPLHRVDFDDWLIRNWSWLLIFFGPLALMSAYMWVAEKYRFANWDADVTAMAVCVLVGTIMLRRKVRADRTLWTILYVPAAAVAVFIWAVIFALR